MSNGNNANVDIINLEFNSERKKTRTHVYSIAIEGLFFIEFSILFFVLVAALFAAYFALSLSTVLRISSVPVLLCIPPLEPY